MVRSRLRQRDRWGFPGGFLRRSETAQDAAMREVKEEVGLDLTDVRLVAEYRQPWSRHFDSLFTATSLCETTKAASIEVSHIGWFDPAQLVDMNVTRETALAIQEHLSEELIPADQRNPRDDSSSCAGDQ